MKKIGFLFGEETTFSQRIIELINSKKKSEIMAEEIKIGIVNTLDKSKYSVIFDRFSSKLPFYSTILNFFIQQDIKIINNPEKTIFDDVFLYTSALKKLKIDVPKTAIIPSKRLPHNIHGNMLSNLIYPLNWEELFSHIGFPANLMSNNSLNEFYDCFRVYNQQDFHSIYDMSGDNTLILQESFSEDCDYYRVFVVGDEKFITKYDCFKPANSRYSIIKHLDKKIETSIISSIKKINKNYDIDFFITDFAISNKKVYLMHINKININLDTAFLPTECYDWLVEVTAELLIKHADISDNKNSKKIKEIKKIKTPKSTSKSLN